MIIQKLKYKILLCSVTPEHIFLLHPFGDLKWPPKPLKRISITVNNKLVYRKAERFRNRQNEVRYTMEIVHTIPTRQKLAQTDTRKVTNEFAPLRDIGAVRYYKCESESLRAHTILKL